MSLQRNEPVRQHPAPQQDERHPPRLAAVTQPPEVRLWWRSAAERNRKLGAWREAVMRFFGEQPRVLRIAWALDGLFNLKTGYAHPSNTWLSRKTGTTMRNVPKALAELEDGGAIVRVVKRSGGTERMIYPAATLLWGDPTVGPGGMATVDTPGDVYRADMQNLESHSATTATLTTGVRPRRCGRLLTTATSPQPRGKQKLGPISKRGDRYLRRILVVGAHAVLKLARQKPEKYPWLTQLLAGKPFKVVAVALANKMARIAWALLVKGGPYRARALVAAV